MDGIDVALVETDGRSIVHRGVFAEYPYGVETRRQIAAGLDDAKAITKDRAARPGNLGQLETELTRQHAEAVNDFLVTNNLKSSEIDVIGFHGQTVLHRPAEKMTMQLGDGALLAELTGIDVVYDMRAADMAAGGQGAPLVPVYHRALAALLADGEQGKWPVAFINIGGISNISYLPRQGAMIAFDTGPGNALIDQWVAAEGGVPFDQGGLIASEGGIDDKLLQRYLAVPYFARKLPKSLDRGDFLPPQAGEVELADGARTLVRLTAETIVGACDHLPEIPKLWIICGGGRKNKMIMQDLHQLVEQQGGRVLSAGQAGFDGDAMEAEAFAYLAVRSAAGLALTYPGTTGCKSATTGGVLVRAG